MTLDANGAAAAPPPMQTNSYAVTFRCGCCLSIRATAGRKRKKVLGLAQWVCAVCVDQRFPPVEARR